MIQELAKDNRLWGAERIRGELLKLGIHVSKRTIQKYMRDTRSPGQRGQTWATFLHTHAKDIWACDFLQVTDLFFRSLFAFFIIDLHSRRVIHVGVTRNPTDAWTAQQLREATPFGQGPKYLIRDRDSKFGPSFAHLAATSGIKILKTPYRTPRANAIWAVCDESVSITYSSSKRSNCIVSLVAMSSTSIRLDHIKASGNRFQNDMVSLSFPITREARSSPCQSWVDYTAITAEVLGSYKFTTEQMVAFRGAHLIEDLAYRRSILPFCTEKGNNREGIARPYEHPEGNHVKHSLMTTLSSQERFSHEEIIEEIKLFLFGRCLK